mmetsp:Transcript_34964/g.81199  ORF Transcript_34964/g.81199 Transcript_34964/m.81199 type:complete len:284 (-) Transcript_34964:152-1003(-)
MPKPQGCKSKGGRMHGMTDGSLASPPIEQLLEEVLVPPAAQLHLQDRPPARGHGGDPMAALVPVEEDRVSHLQPHASIAEGLAGVVLAALEEVDAAAEVGGRREEHHHRHLGPVVPVRLDGAGPSELPDVVDDVLDLWEELVALLYALPQIGVQGSAHGHQAIVDGPVQLLQLELDPPDLVLVHQVVVSVVDLLHPRILPDRVQRGHVLLAKELPYHGDLQLRLLGGEKLVPRRFRRVPPDLEDVAIAVVIVVVVVAVPNVHTGAVPLNVSSLVQSRLEDAPV